MRELQRAGRQVDSYQARQQPGQAQVGPAQKGAQAVGSKRQGEKRQQAHGHERRPERDRRQPDSAHGQEPRVPAQAPQQQDPQPCRNEVLRDPAQSRHRRRVLQFDVRPPLEGKTSEQELGQPRAFQTHIQTRPLFQQRRAQDVHAAEEHQHRRRQPDAPPAAALRGQTQQQCDPDPSPQRHGPLQRAQSPKARGQARRHIPAQVVAQERRRRRRVRQGQVSPQRIGQKRRPRVTAQIQQERAVVGPIVVAAIE